MMFYVVGRRCRVFLIKIKTCGKKKQKIFISRKKWKQKRQHCHAFLFDLLQLLLKPLLIVLLSYYGCLSLTIFCSVASAVIAIDLSRSFFLSFVVLQLIVVGCCVTFQLLPQNALDVVSYYKHLNCGSLCLDIFPFLLLLIFICQFVNVQLQFLSFFFKTLFTVPFRLLPSLLWLD